MSISTGDNRRPAEKLSTSGQKAVATESRKPPAPRSGTGAKASGARKSSTARPGKGAAKGSAKGSAKGRKPIAPVKIREPRPWGTIAMFVSAGLTALAIIGFMVFKLATRASEPPWEERAAAIEGIVNYRETNPGMLTREHNNEDLTYPVSPPAGGNHNDLWQNCMGDVYTSPVADEHAVHSLEHGAVWVTYRPDLPADQVERLASKVRDRSYTFMSPYPGLDKAVSLQAWGYQLKVDSVDDPRIEEFISALRQNASVEPGASCSGGLTDATGTPLNLGGGMKRE